MPELGLPGHADTARGGGIGAAEVFRVFLRLGCTSFGGPVAHLGYFRTEFVGRRAWLAEADYADIVALCQVLPGPASSQVAVSLGMRRAGLMGAVAAWGGFTLPSAVLMVLFALGVSSAGLAGARWLHGLQVVAVAVVAQAVWGMARSLCPDRLRATVAVGAAVLALAVPLAAGQIGAIAAGALVGWRLIPDAPAGGAARDGVAGLLPSRRRGVVALAVFAGLLAVLPLLAATGHGWALVWRFYRAGSLVFGGGHVVLPLLQDAVVPPGWIGDPAFMAGYGAVQAVPGPLFTFAAYLGAAMGPAPRGVAGAVLCLVAIYLPSFLLLIGVLPFWEGLRRRAGVGAALRGVNAAVVGLLAAALYSPVWTTAIHGAGDFALALVAFLLLAGWKTPPWVVVGVGALVSSVV